MEDEVTEAEVIQSNKVFSERMASKTYVFIDQEDTEVEDDIMEEEVTEVITEEVMAVGTTTVMVGVATIMEVDTTPAVGMEEVGTFLRFSMAFPLLAPLV